jgi:hypothetical protein
MDIECNDGVRARFVDDVVDSSDVLKSLRDDTAAPVAPPHFDHVSSTSVRLINDFYTRLTARRTLSIDADTHFASLILTTRALSHAKLEALVVATDFLQLEVLCYAACQQLAALYNNDDKSKEVVTR